MRGRPTFGRAGVVAVLACAGAVACSGPGGPAHHRVEIRDADFHPRTLSVAPGDTVTWINRDVVPHTVTSDGGGWDSGHLAARERFTLVVPEGGTGGYACLYHPAMTAALGMP